MAALQAILLSPQLPQWALKILAPAVGATLALAAALAAACFVRVFGDRLSRAAAERRRRSRARETDPISVAAMGILAALCLLAGIFPAFFIDELAPAVRRPRRDADAGAGWEFTGFRSCRSPRAAAPTTAFSCSFSSRPPPRSPPLRSIDSPPTLCGAAPAWDCGFPDANPATQYTAESFAEPIRRVSTAPSRSALKSASTCRRRANCGRPVMSVEMHDLVWEFIYRPVVHAVEFLALRLNHLQFLTIRQYLSVVFGALVSLLLVLASWP